MDWRTWVYERLMAEFTTDDAFIAASGSLTQSPAQKPFMVITLGTSVPAVADASFTDMLLWMHDDPGDYTRIDQYLKRARNALCGQVSVNQGMACSWQGDSTDLADDTYKTITRNASFRLVGRDNNVVD